MPINYIHDSFSFLVIVDACQFQSVCVLYLMKEAEGTTLFHLAENAQYSQIWDEMMSLVRNSD